MPPIDPCRSMADGGSPASPCDHADAILEGEPRCLPVHAVLPGIERLLNAFCAMPLRRRTPFCRCRTIAPAD